MPLTAKEIGDAFASFEDDKQNARPRFTLFRDLEENSTKMWLVDRMFGDGEASVMYGKPGDGKSVLAEDLGLHVAAGLTWHGRKVKQGAVIYIALERYRLVKRRAIALRKKHKLVDPPFAIVGGVFDMRQASAVEAICDIVKEVEAATGQAAVLIVIDTLSRALCGGDENSSKDMGALVAATGRLQDATDAHVMWVHHSPLAADDRMRGHSVLLGAIDTAVHVLKRTDGVRSATVIKANDSDEGEMIAFTLESVTTGTNTTAPVVVPSEGEAARRPAPKPIKLPNSAQIALRALNELLADGGSEIAPASSYIPAGAKVVKIDTWRAHAYRRGISSGEPRAQQKAFERSFQRLVAAQKIGAWGEYVWPA